MELNKTVRNVTIGLGVIALCGGTFVITGCGTSGTKGHSNNTRIKIEHSNVITCISTVGHLNSEQEQDRLRYYRSINPRIFKILDNEAEYISSYYSDDYPNYYFANESLQVNVLTDDTMVLAAETAKKELAEAKRNNTVISDDELEVIIKNSILDAKKIVKEEDKNKKEISKYTYALPLGTIQQRMGELVGYATLDGDYTNGLPYHK